MAIISAAQAAGETLAPAPGGGWSQILILVVFVVVFYWVLIRPQSKRAKSHRDLLLALEVGDEIVTNGGVMGKIIKISGDVVVLNISEGVEIKLQKMAIASLLPKGTLKST